MRSSSARVIATSVVSVAVDCVGDHIYPEYRMFGRVSEVLHVIGRYWQAEARLMRRRRATQGSGVFEAAAAYVRACDAAESACSAGELAAHLGITSASTTALIDRVERERVPVRCRSDHDRRRVLHVPGPCCADVHSGPIDAEITHASDCRS